jgi:hypothetical protein
MNMFMHGIEEFLIDTLAQPGLLETTDPKSLMYPCQSSLFDKIMGPKNLMILTDVMGNTTARMR